MGNIEEKHSKIVRKTKIQELIMRILLADRTVALELLIPNVQEQMNVLGLRIGPRQNEIIGTAASRLKKKGLLKFQNGHYIPTKYGEKIWNEWQLSDYEIRKPRKWDGKWRIVIFDIEESKKNVRNKVREIFIKAGFYRLQDSVWVYPHDCEDVIGLLKQDLGVYKEVLYIIADQIENDRHLRYEFDLIH
jgi:DNA-binding transcriptional regulator PaaX